MKTIHDYERKIDHIRGSSNQKKKYIRGSKVMLDKDLAELCSVETKQLKRQVRRNIERFPDDFMFELDQRGFENSRSQFGTSN